MLNDAAETAARIARALDDGTDGSALRAFLDYADELERHEETGRRQLASSEPGPTGSPAWDAALAALVDFRLTEPKPSWIDLPGRFLASPQAPQLDIYDLPPDLSDVPPEFLRRNVLIERRTLHSV